MTQLLWDRTRGEQLEKLIVTGMKWQDGNGGGCSRSSSRNSSSSSSRQQNRRADQCYVGKGMDRNLCENVTWA